ncbi:hypothetical protein B0O99DRAFT_598343 [Bisporella sp. PMI_857]|nr:hypothetical protein B0O99DRAFT_598343 [Bisporella sp. PMI_857]
MASNTNTNPDPPPSHAESESQTAYQDLRRLIPSLASELDALRTSLREHNLWIQRYGHSQNSSTSSTTSPPSPDPDPAPPVTSQGSGSELPAYSAPDVPPYTPGPQSTTDDVRQRRDQITEWLREGEDVLREYSARFAQLGEELNMPFDDVLGTWTESSVDNALPDYERVEQREELMVGGVLQGDYFTSQDSPEFISYMRNLSATGTFMSQYDDESPTVMASSDTPFSGTTVGDNTGQELLLGPHELKPHGQPHEQVHIKRPLRM